VAMGWLLVSELWIENAQLKQTRGAGPPAGSAGARCGPGRIQKHPYRSSIRVPCQGRRCVSRREATPDPPSSGSWWTSKLCFAFQCRSDSLAFAATSAGRNLITVFFTVNSSSQFFFRHRAPRRRRAPRSAPCGARRQRLRNLPRIFDKNKNSGNSRTFLQQANAPDDFVRCRGRRRRQRGARARGCPQAEKNFPRHAPFRHRTSANAQNCANFFALFDAHRRAYARSCTASRRQRCRRSDVRVPHYAPHHRVTRTRRTRCIALHRHGRCRHTFASAGVTACCMCATHAFGPERTRRRSPGDARTASGTADVGRRRRARVRLRCASPSTPKIRRDVRATSA